MTDHVLNAEAGILGATLKFGANILHISIPGLSQFRFEWHSSSLELYVIHVSTTQEIGELLSPGVRDKITAERVVSIWSNGYQAGKLEL